MLYVVPGQEFGDGDIIMSLTLKDLHPHEAILPKSTVISKSRQTTRHDLLSASPSVTARLPPSLVSHHHLTSRITH